MHYMNRQGETTISYLGLGADPDSGGTKRVLDPDTAQTVYYEAEDPFLRVQNCI